MKKSKGTKKPEIKKVEMTKDINAEKIIKAGCWGPSPDDLGNTC